nr:hypothetical protein [uncultured Acetatifactor sp.]
MGQLFEDLVVKWGTIKAYEIAEEMAEEKAEEIAKEKALEEKKASARRMIARGKLTLEEIAEDSDLPIEAVRDLAGLQLA